MSDDKSPLQLLRDIFGQERCTEGNAGKITISIPAPIYANPAFREVLLSIFGIIKGTHSESALDSIVIPNELLKKTLNGGQRIESHRELGDMLGDRLQLGVIKAESDEQFTTIANIPDGATATILLQLQSLVTQTNITTLPIGGGRLLPEGTNIEIYVDSDRLDPNGIEARQETLKQTLAQISHAVESASASKVASKVA